MSRCDLIIVEDDAQRGLEHPVILEARRQSAGRKSYFLAGTPIFSRQQIDLLKALVDAENSPALVAGYGDGLEREKGHVRRTKLRFLNTGEHRWIDDIIWVEANRANALFQFEVLPVLEIQLARYDAEDQGFFEWHADTVPEDLTRKISITVPLSDPHEFEGGIMEFNENGAIHQPRQSNGCPIMFPSWLLHRVTPVTAGRRYSLVAWIRGPAWR